MDRHYRHWIKIFWRLIIVLFLPLLIKPVLGNSYEAARIYSYKSSGSGALQYSSGYALRVMGWYFIESKETSRKALRVEFFLRPNTPDLWKEWKREQYTIAYLEATIKLNLKDSSSPLHTKLLPDQRPRTLNGPYIAVSFILPQVLNSPYRPRLKTGRIPEESVSKNINRDRIKDPFQEFEWLSLRLTLIPQGNFRASHTLSWHFRNLKGNFSGEFVTAAVNLNENG